MDTKNKTLTVNILSIDAWRSCEGGWEWNDWHRIEADYLVAERVLDSPRMLLAQLRRDGFLSDASIGKLAIEDDQHNVVIIDKNTFEPLIALEYGHNY